MRFCVSNEYTSLAFRSILEGRNQWLLLAGEIFESHLSEKPLSKELRAISAI